MTEREFLESVIREAVKIGKTAADGSISFSSTEIATRHLIEAATRQARATPELPQVSDAIKHIASQLYQCAGAYDMPASVLDVLSALSSGEVPENVSLLPMESPKPQALPQGVEEWIADRGIHDESWYGSECVERTYILAEDFREFARAVLARESEPVAHVVTHTTGGNAGLAKHIHWLPHSQSVMPGDLLYLHPPKPQALPQVPEGMAIVPSAATRQARATR